MHCVHLLDMTNCVAAQVMIIPISEGSLGYAEQVRTSLRSAKLHVEVDGSSNTMKKKVRAAQLAQFNYILVRAGVSLLPFRLYVWQHAANKVCHRTCRSRVTV